MARAKKVSKKIFVESYKHESAKRKNIPTAKMAGEGVIPSVAKAEFSFSAHLSPELRFDTTGRSDKLREIAEKAAAGQKLTSDEAEILRGLAANSSQPWLEWSGKKEEHDRHILAVEPVALHIHERVSANAIIRAAKREDIQTDLFADPQQEYKEAIQFYQHDVDWANRLILGDSLEVMSSLSRREDLASKVQMIYIDPPYGINYKSNFQPEIGSVEVKDKDTDLTREPEVVRAYRDTWHLGIHSYLTYLRDRVLVAKELLTDEGSLFLQIGQENIHLVRNILDGVFGPKSAAGIITVQKTATPSGLLDDGAFYILWYLKNPENAKFRSLPMEKPCDEWVRETKGGSWGVEIDRIRRALFPGEKKDISVLPKNSSVYCLSKLTSSGASANPEPLLAFGQEFGLKSNEHWKTTKVGLDRLIGAERIETRGRAWFVKFHSDSPVKRMTNIWIGTAGKSESDNDYIVKTETEVIKRCLLMTTDPGDLVLDPTCGGGTTARVAEEWGRRWVTIDTSRVSISLSRQRLLRANYDFYQVKNNQDRVRVGAGIDPSCNFVYKTIPHIELRTISRNESLDPILKNYQEILDEKLQFCNAALSNVDEQLRPLLVGKLSEKLQTNGLRLVTDADRRRWLLPGTSKLQIKEGFLGKPKLNSKHADKYFSFVPANNIFEHWNVPFDTDPNWPQPLSDAVNEYRMAWCAKMDEINACIYANADQETLVDQPEVVSGIVRVTGPFTVEGVRPEELSLDENGEVFDPTPNEWEVNDSAGDYAQNASAYVDRMLQLIEQDGVTFPNNEHRKFGHTNRLEDTDSALHAEALWEGDDSDQPCHIAIAFGPQYGPVTAIQIEDLVRASRRYDELVIAGFSFDGASQAVIQESANPRLKIHMAHIRPDASPGMDGLLKDSPKSQLFTVFGQPEIEVRSVAESKIGEVEVELLGVDIYSPLTGEITSSGALKVAAWFLDSDYDGRCFCITQAFFPNQKAWDKIAKALGSSADAEAFAAYDGTVSIPFEPGEYRRIAVKVIDPRGNEVMAIRTLEESS